MSREVDLLLARAHRRHRRIEAVQRAAIGVAAGGAVGIALRLASLAPPWAATAAAAGGLVALALRRRPDDLALACRLDRAAGLGSALTAAVEFRDRSDPWATAQRGVVAPLLTHLDLATLLPWRGRGWGVVAATLVAAALLLPGVRPDRVKPPAATEPAVHPGVARPTSTTRASHPRLRASSGPRTATPPHDRAVDGPLAAKETTTGPGRRAPSRHGNNGGGRGGGLGNAPATGPLLTDAARAGVAATGETAAVATRGRGLLPAPTAAAPTPAATGAGRLAPDPVATLPLHRRAAVAHYFALLHSTPGATP